MQGANNCFDEFVGLFSLLFADFFLVTLFCRYKWRVVPTKLFILCHQLSCINFCSYHLVYL